MYVVSFIHFNAFYKIKKFTKDIFKNISNHEYKQHILFICIICYASTYKIIPPPWQYSFNHAKVYLTIFIKLSNATLISSKLNIIKY